MDMSLKNVVIHWKAHGMPYMGSVNNTERSQCTNVDEIDLLRDLALPPGGLEGPELAYFFRLKLPVKTV